MDVRAQVGLVIHLDKCIGCHTCSVGCKNVWTDRRGAETMWWNNVETKPGTGYPAGWEDQERFRGGFEKRKSRLRLRALGRFKGAATILYSPSLPQIDDYYHPSTFELEHLVSATEGADQPVARSMSAITGETMEIGGGPAWDDGLAGSTIHASADPNLRALSGEERDQLFDLERLCFFHLPRLCNHCLNPACVAACPSGALHKRGEDGLTLLDQERCRAWRLCVSACPYKKSYFNWEAGKSEKCILCYPRLEVGQPPVCFHSCVGRARYLGVLLVDAERIQEVASGEDSSLVDRQRELILDPRDPAVLQAAKKNGLGEDLIEAAQRSPVYRWVVEWRLALPLHPEYRTLPNLFYVPPLLPVMAQIEARAGEALAEEEPFAAMDRQRLPLAYLAALFGAGNEAPVRYSLRKLLAARAFRRSLVGGDVSSERASRMLLEADCSAEEAEEIFRLTVHAAHEERFVLPPSHREKLIESLEGSDLGQGRSGLGFRKPPHRGAGT